MINIGHERGLLELKKHVFFTSLPWLDFTSIQHPQFLLKTPDIPAIAWGKFNPHGDGTIEMPFSVQAHHGFVDGVHIHLLAQSISATVKDLINKA